MINLFAAVFFNFKYCTFFFCSFYKSKNDEKKNHVQSRNKRRQYPLKSKPFDWGPTNKPKTENTNHLIELKTKTETIRIYRNRFVYVIKLIWFFFYLFVTNLIMHITLSEQWIQSVAEINKKNCNKIIRIIYLTFTIRFMNKFGSYRIAIYFDFYFVLRYILKWLGFRVIRNGCLF